MSTIAIVGAGPLLGMGIARKFGKQGFKVALISRSAQSLDKYVGQTITLVQQKMMNSSTVEESVEAKLLSNNAGTVWEIGGKIVVNPPYSRMIFPSTVAISGSIFGPRNSSATTRMTAISLAPRLNTGSFLYPKVRQFHPDSTIGWVRHAWPSTGRSYATRVICRGGPSV